MRTNVVPTRPVLYGGLHCSLRAFSHQIHDSKNSKARPLVRTPMGRVHESQSLNAGQYPTIVDCVSNRPVPCDLYSAYFLQDHDTSRCCEGTTDRVVSNCLAKYISLI